MTNLSDLFPAGAGKQVSFVADGAISAAGKPVVLTAVGKVAPIAGADAAYGSVGEIGTSATTENTQDMACTYDANADKIVVCYRRSSGAGYSAVGTVSGTGISFGTPVEFRSSGSPNKLSMTYDANAQKVVVAYTNSGNTYLYAKVGTVTGTSISWGAESTIDSFGDWPTLAYDVNAQKVVCAFIDDGNSSYPSAYVGAIAGTGISWGAQTVYKSLGGNSVGCGYDSTNQTMLCASTHAASTGAGVNIGTVSGSSISFGGSWQAFTTLFGYYPRCQWDSANQRIIATYQNDSDQYGRAFIGSVSGTTITWGSEIVFNSAASYRPWVIFNSSAGVNKAYFVYNTVGSSGPATGITATVSGLTATFDTAVAYGATNNVGATTNQPALDTSTGLIASLYAPDAGGYYFMPSCKMFTTPYSNLTATNFIGISDAAILDTASGNITIKGGIAATGLTSLTPGSDYYAQDDGTITTATAGKKIGKAMSATSINLEYQS